MTAKATISVEHLAPWGRRQSMNPKISVSVVFVAAMFMNIMDITIVNVALPSIGRQFFVSEASLDSVAIGYLVSLAVVTPAAGWMGDRFGSKRVLLSAIAVFTTASVLCGVAGSLPELVAFRVLQGVGGGMMTPVGMALLFRTFAPQERVRASSILTIPTAVAPALGPVLGGLLVNGLSWRWVFYVNLPIGAAAVAFGLLFLDDHRQPRPGRFDGVGFVLSGVGFAVLMFGISEGPSRNWDSPQILGCIAVGVVLLALLVRTQLTTEKPLLQLRLFGDRLFRSSTAVMSIGMAAFLGSLFVVPLFFQLGLGLSALQSGLNTLPEAIGVMLGAQIGTRLLYRRIGPRRLVAAGLSGVAGFIAAMSLIGADTDLWWMRLLMFGMGLCFAQLVISTQAASFATVAPAQIGSASSLFTMGRQLGSAAGVAILATVLAAVGTTRLVSGHPSPNLAAYHAAFLVGAVLALLAAAASLTISDADAAVTMGSPDPSSPEATTNAGPRETRSAVSTRPVPSH